MHKLMVGSLVNQRTVASEQMEICRTAQAWQVTLLADITLLTSLILSSHDIGNATRRPTHPLLQQSLVDDER